MNLTRRSKSPKAITTGSTPPLVQFRSAFDRLFDRFWLEPWGISDDLFNRQETWFPAIDLAENDTELTIRAELPGVEVKDVNVSLTDQTLTISGEKTEETEQKSEEFFHCERRFGSFKRVIDLPATIDRTKVSAEFADGVMTIHAPKVPTAQPKRIEVKPKVNQKQTRQVPVGAA